MMRVLIADDEPLARQSVRSALSSDPEVETIAESADGLETVAAIGELQPDLVLLDIRMPGLDGFEVIQEVGVTAMPPVVFVTAFDEHALRAFDVHAFDYVLKPFEDARLLQAVEEARRRIALEHKVGLAERLAALLQEEATDYIRRVMVRERDVMSIVAVDDICWIEAAGNYIRLHLDNGRNHYIRSTLIEIEQKLDPSRFKRIHRSTIINLGCLREVRPLAGGDCTAVLAGGVELRVSRTHRRALLEPMY